MRRNGTFGKGGGEVSIHASVKDATIIQLFSRMNILVSIHASVKDATFE